MKSAFNTRDLARKALKGQVQPVFMKDDVYHYNGDNDATTCFSCLFLTAVACGLLDCLESVWGRSSVISWKMKHRASDRIYWFMNDTCDYEPLN